ncbi:MAG: hypothetical protein OHK0035_11020 [Cyanobacteria bacterium J069]
MLAARLWHAADQKTYALMCNILGQQGAATSAWAIAHFPCDDFQKIDRLWVEASDGVFGFSVQKSIWDDICETVHDWSEVNQYRKQVFRARVGWKQPTDETALLGPSVAYEDLCLSKAGQLPNGRATQFFAFQQFCLEKYGESWAGTSATVSEYGFAFDPLMQRSATCLAAPDQAALAADFEQYATQLLHHADPSLRSLSARSLGNLRSDRAVPLLLSAIADPSAPVRRSVVNALGKIGSAAAIPAITAAIDDADWNVRRLAIEAAGTLKGDEAIPALMRAMERALTPDLPRKIAVADTTTQQNILQALRNIGSEAAKNAIAQLNPAP